MSKPVDLMFAFGLPPKEAIAYFKSKGYKLSANALDAYEAIKEQAFTVTGIARKDLLQELKSGIYKALKDGTTFEEYKNHVNDVLIRKGWQTSNYDLIDGDGEIVAPKMTPYRLKTIFRTNIQSAYMAGRYKQMQGDIEIAPYWQYLAVMDARTRPSHRAAHGMVFRHDDSFWDTHYPPCDFNCRCTVRSLRERDLTRFNLDLSSSEGMLSDTEQEIGKTGITVTTKTFKKDKFSRPFTPRVGFGQKPIFKQITAVVGQKLAEGDAQIVAAAMKHTPQLQMALNREYQTWVKELLEQRQSRLSHYTVGVFINKVQQYLIANNIIFDTATITLRDKEFLHFLRDTKLSRGATIDENVALNLPAYIANPAAILFDKEDQALIYVLKTKNNKADKLVVRVNRSDVIKVDGKKERIRMNAIRSAGKVLKENLSSKRYELIDGEL